MRSGRTQLVVAILALASVLAFSACGESAGSAEDTQVSLTLDAHPNPNHAGIYTARERGYFADAGLDVTIRPPSGSQTPIEQVAGGRTDLAIAYGPEVVIAEEKGLDVVVVASVANSALTSLIWLGDSDVNEISELRGKVIATGGIPYRDAFLKTVLAYGDVGVDEVKTIDVGDRLLPVLISGRVDASLGSFRNIEGEALRATGADPVVDPVTWAGVPRYDELVLVAQGERLEEDSEAIRLFLTALFRGTAKAKESRKATVALMREVGSEVESKVLRAQVDDTLQLLSPEGVLGIAAWDEFIAWMHENELIEAPMPASEVLTNEYLPSEVSD